MSFSSLTYNPDIPNPPNVPSVDVPKMQTNTNSIQSFLERDHVPFSNSFAGAHLQANLKNTATGGTPTLPSLIAGAGYETLYSTTNSDQIGGNSGELYFTRAASSVQIQLTGPGNPTANAVLNPAWNLASAGSTFLPGGILLQWGLTNTVTTPLVITFPIAFRNLLCITLGPIASSAGRFFTLTGQSATGFTVSNSTGAGSTGCYWMAIGN